MEHLIGVLEIGYRIPDDRFDPATNQLVSKTGIMKEMAEVITEEISGKNGLITRITTALGRVHVQ
jgi:hypothetical protein